MTPSECKIRLDELRGVVVLPTYNNARTLMQVIDEVRPYATGIIVVNDGSTDATGEILRNAAGINVLQYDDGRNRGKGYAVRLALSKALEMGYRYAITMDSDGQHFASDIPTFVRAIEQDPDSLLIGARNLSADGMPSKNTFANKFSNFWFTVETTQKLADTQSGFRLYPIQRMKDMHFFCSRYEFEVEVIVRTAWKGVTVKNVPIKVIYPEDRVTHFRPLKDFTRISLLNATLVIASLFVFYPRQILKWLSPRSIAAFLRRNLWESTESNMRLSAAVGIGTMMGIMPVWGFQMAIGIALAFALKLNKLLVIAFSNVSLPPVIPFIIYGSLYMGGLLMGRPTLLGIDEVTLEKALMSLGQYALGGVVLAICVGALAFVLSLLVLTLFRRTPRR